MNTKQYIPNSANPFDCEYYGKEYPYTQHIAEHRFIQSEGRSFSEYRHSQAGNMNSEQFVTFEASSYSSGVYGLNFPQNQPIKDHRLVHSNVLPLGEQRNFQAINMTTQPYTPGGANYSANDVNGINLTQQQRFHDAALPIGSDSSDSGIARKEKKACERPCLCEFCGRGFSDVTSLTAHSRIHSGDRPFPCKECDKKFATREGLRSHLVCHSEERRFECDFCNRRFLRKQEMQRHRLIHTGERPFVCEVCQMAFPLKRTLNIHMRKHTEKRPYACDQCDKKFKSNNELNKHGRYHSKVKPFLCELCPMRFYARNNLKLHQRIHTGVKPFHCQMCPMRYSNKNSFIKHIRTHDKQSDSQTLDDPNIPPVEKNARNVLLCSRTIKELYMCSICREEFANDCELEKHRLHHKREKPFSCFICAVRFFRSPNLKLHLSTFHASESTQEDSGGEKSPKSQHFCCTLCNKSFSSKSHLQNHIRCHLRSRNFPKNQGEYTCDQCESRFTFLSSLRYHVLTHSMRKKPHQCTVCSKSFMNSCLLRKHSRVHTNKKPYVCPICENKYKRRDSVLRHIREQHDKQNDLQMAECSSVMCEMSSEQHASDEENISLAVLKERIMKAKHSVNKDV